MKAVLVIAVAAFAVPALAQTGGPRNDVSLGVPNCVSNGTCPGLRATLVRQLGLAPAAPAAGGPFEPAAAAQPPRVAEHYPPCRSRSDDRCIQGQARARR